MADLEEISLMYKLMLLMFSTLGIMLVATAVWAQTEDITESPYWPCDTCHPHEYEISDKLPIRAHKEQSDLKVHDILGKERNACRVCHLGDENPAKLKLLNGETVSIVDGVPELCHGCHQERYNMWKEGIHGDYREWKEGKLSNPPKCTTVGCHNPHNPTMTVDVAEERVKAIFTKALTQSIIEKRVPNDLELPWPPAPYQDYKYYPIPPKPHFPLVNTLIALGTLAVLALLIIPALIRRKSE